MDTQNIRKLHARHHFHSVGHGLFYSFDMTDHESNEEGLVFVYDCGTKSQRHFLRTEIKSFEKRHGEKTPIDLLVLSRFSYDHFLGLLSLLENRGKGEMVFLPKLSAAEKLFHTMLATENGYDEEYMSFIQDPSLLLAKYFKKVILLKKAERPLMFNPTQVEPSKERFELISDSDDQTQCDDNAYLRTNSGWIFYFYLSIPENFRLKQIEDELFNLGFSQKSFSEVLSNAVSLNKIKSIFAKHQWTEYETTLACIHGASSATYCCPTGFWYARRCLHFLEHHLVHKRWFSLGGKDFCILTGSSNLSKNWGDLRDKLQKISGRISIFTIPHHGEHQHWNDAIVGDMDPDAWVVSSRLLSLFVSGHRVLSAVKYKSRGGEICSVHEFRNMTIERIFILKGEKVT